MLFTKVLSLGVLAGVACAAAVVAPYAEGSESTVTTYTGEAFGVPFELVGDSASVLKQLAELHPGKDLTQIGHHNDTGIVDERGLEKRDMILPPLCIPVAGQNWNSCDGPDARKGRQWMRNMGGTVAVPARTCWRLICFGSSELRVCNDRPWTQVLARSRLADSLDRLSSDCASYPPFRSYITGGQLFDTDYFNVIIKMARC